MHYWQNFRTTVMMRVALMSLALTMSSSICSAPVTPPPGSADRVALMSALRSELAINSKFVVTHLKVAGDWAYFEGNETVPGNELMDTDMTINALLKRVHERWLVVIYRTLTDDQRYSYQRFEKSLNQIRQNEGLPKAMFP